MSRIKPTIAVIDYGMGNLRSVQKAFESKGARAVITSSPSAIASADGVVLPGVGAFGEAARRLRIGRLLKPILSTIENNKPFLGICLGLQLLFERSEESPRERGLGVFKGSVVRFPRKTRNLKVPHMGWNALGFAKAGDTPYLRGIRSGDHFYFVHSYFPEPRDHSLVATTTSYGRAFCSSVARGRLFASQFHPEKSGRLGLRIVSNFVKEASR